jgi:hypothetical protein
MEKKRTDLVTEMHETEVCSLTPTERMSMISMWTGLNQFMIMKCEHDNETSGSIKIGSFLMNYQLLRNNQNYEVKNTLIMEGIHKSKRK